MCGLHIACMQPSGAAAWLYMCAAVSGQRARWGARISCELAPWPRHAQTTTLHGDATEFYYRPSDPQLPQRTASRYPIPRAERDGAGSPGPAPRRGRTHPDGFLIVY